VKPLRGRFIPFRWKILGGFLLLTGAVLGASLLIVDRDQTRQAKEDVTRELSATRTTFRTLLDRRERQLAAALALLARDFAFKKAIAMTRDPGTIESAAQSIRNEIGVDAVWVTDEDGTLYADTTHRLAPGTSVASLPTIAAALGGETASNIVVMDGVPFQLAAAPIYAPDPIGVLAAGFRIEDDVIGELKRITRADVSFAAQGRIFASTLDDAGRALLAEHLATLPVDHTALIGRRGDRQIVLAVRPTPEVTVTIQRSWDQALAPLRRQERLILLVGVLAFGLTALVGFFLADGVTASMRKLAAATGRVVEGDYEVRVTIPQRDEIGELGNAFNRMVEGLQEREKIRSLLRKTVSREIADELLRRGEIDLGGAMTEVSVLFSDIRGFTSIAERLQPQELVGQLNAYFTRMARAIEAQGGVIDKYVGDAIMALFGAPVRGEDDAARAQRAALEMIAALDILNRERRDRGLPPWVNGIGIHSGTAVAGTMGSQDRWSYTVLGDSVNLASRLEGITRHYGARIIVSGATRRAAGDGFLYRTLDLVRVRGRAEPVEIFELLAEAAEAPGWLAPFEKAVRAYRDGDFPLAREGFAEVLRRRESDTPSCRYLDRLEALAASLPDDWDPAHTMEEK
jgi:adenylate cyclase